MPVSYPGMPADRWWQFEDARVDFGAVDSEPDDLLRLLMVEFARMGRHPLEAQEL